MPATETNRPFARDFTAAAQRTLTQLRRKFPHAFREVKPLKLGIREDILARTKLTELDLYHFMTFYTGSVAYLRAQAEPGAMRYDLDGRAIEPVSEDNREYASVRLNAIYHDQRDRSQYLAFRAQLLDPTEIPEVDEP